MSQPDIEEHEEYAMTTTSDSVIVSETKSDHAILTEVADWLDWKRHGNVAARLHRIADRMRAEAAETEPETDDPGVKPETYPPTPIGYAMQSVKVSDIYKVATVNATNGNWRLHSWHPDPSYSDRILVLWERTGGE